MSSLNNRNISIRHALEGDWLLVLCLFFSVTTLFFHYYEIFAIIPVFLILIKKRLSKKCRTTSFILFVFSVFFVVSFILRDDISSRSNYLTYFFPPIFYMAGCYIGDKYKKNEKVLLCILFIMLLMYAANDFIQLMKAVFLGDSLIIDTRTVYNDLGRDTRSATGYALILSVLVVGVAFIFSPRQTGIIKIIRFLGITLGLLAIIGMVALVTRTTIVQSMVLLLVSLYMFMKEKTKNKVGFGLLLSLVAIILLTNYFFKSGDLFQFIDAYQSRNEIDENLGYGFAGSRMDRWPIALLDVFFHPLGTASGKMVSEYTNSYAHNMWLDVGLTAGWVPFVILLVISVNNVYTSYKIWLDHNYGYFTRLYFFSLMVIFMLGCFVEPVLGALFNHFLVYLVFCGIVSEMKPPKKRLNFRTTSV